MKIIYGILTIAMGVLWWTRPVVPRFGIVDMQALIAQKAQAIAKTPGAKVLPEHIDELKHVLQQVAEERHVVLLVKGAVIGGDLPDMTDEIRQGYNP